MESDDSMDEFTTQSKVKFKETKEKDIESIKNCCKENFIGLKFYSDDEVATFMKKLQEKSKKNYFIRDQKKKLQLKNVKRTQCNNNIYYRFILYQCIHGPVRDTMSTGKRKAL